MCEAFSRSINSKALAFAKMNGAIITQSTERCQPESLRIFPLSNATNLRRPAPKRGTLAQNVTEKCLSVSSFLRCFVNMED
jgi:hypothetical protein